MMNVFILRNTLKRYWWLTVLCYLSLILKKVDSFQLRLSLIKAIPKFTKWLYGLKINWVWWRSVCQNFNHDHQHLSGLWIVNLTHIFVTLWICYWCIRPLMCIYDSLWREKSVLLIDTKNIYMYFNPWIIILNVYFVQFLLSLKFIWCHSFLLFVSFINLILVTYSWVSAHLNRRLKWAVSKLTCFIVISWSKITAFHPNLSHITLRRGQNGS